MENNNTQQASETKKENNPARDAEIRSAGKKMLDKLKAQGPSLDKVGQVFVRVNFHKNNN